MPTNGGAQKTSWLAQNVVGVLGLASLAYGSYLSFQSDVSAKVSALEVRVAVLEAEIRFAKGGK